MSSSRPKDSGMSEVTVRVHGHRGESLVITPGTRCDHVLDALFDDIVLEGLKRVVITTEGITMTFATQPVEKVARERLLQLLGPPRWVVQE